MRWRLAWAKLFLAVGVVSGMLAWGPMFGWLIRLRAGVEPGTALDYALELAIHGELAMLGVAIPLLCVLFAVGVLVFHD